MKSRPQIGIMPKEIWEHRRLIDLAECIERHIIHQEPIQEKWVQEYNELIDKLGKDAFIIQEGNIVTEEFKRQLEEKYICSQTGRPCSDCEIKGCSFQIERSAREEMK